MKSILGKCVLALFKVVWVISSGGMGFEPEPMGFFYILGLSLDTRNTYLLCARQRARHMLTSNWTFRFQLPKLWYQYMRSIYFGDTGKKLAKN